MEWTPLGSRHTGLLEAMTDYGFAASFDNAGAEEKVLFAELGIVHANRIGSEVIGLRYGFSWPARRGWF
jgi:hypothetical protein